jgi:UDP-N-acetyl-D-galactosamine dehydrogenase
LGYVGLPLALSLSKHFEVIGFDIDNQRILELQKGVDVTGECSKKEIIKSKLFFTKDDNNLKKSNIFIITVPTPVNKFNNPDLRNIIKASKLVAKNLIKKSLVVYESTVYPGCTEEVLIPIIEKITKFIVNKDFFVGYSPERIDPGISKYKLNNQTKIISGSNLQAIKILKNIYSKIIEKKLFIAEDIKTAEAAKIIENTQRDINIAFVNELSMLFHKLNINTKEVLNAANTKWNFINFVPGLVGGHCIGVDPYYLKYKAIKSGLKPFMISSGRKVNDSMPKFIFNETKKIIKKKNKNKILFLGITFKEDCNDIRNSKALELCKFFKKKNKVDIYDPVVNKKALGKFHNIKTINKFKKNYYDIIIITVPHKKIRKLSIKFLRSLGKKNLNIIDVKSIFPKKMVEWQL